MVSSTETLVRLIRDGNGATFWNDSRDRSFWRAPVDACPCSRLRQSAQLARQLFGVTDELHDIRSTRHERAAVLAGALERATDSVDDFGGPDRLYEKVVGAAAKRANRGFERGACCQKQHTRYRSVETEGGEGVGELQAAHVRHVEIADDDRDFFTRGNGCECLLRIAADRST